MSVYLTIFFMSVSAISLFAGELEDAYLRDKMLPFVRSFVRSNGLPYDTNFGPERIVRYKVEFLTNRPAVLSNMRVEKRYAFHLFELNGMMDIHWFKDVSVETYFDLSAAPKDKIQAVRSLNLRNKLNDQTALALARKYFRLQGHKEENFLPVEFRQMSWATKGEPDYVPLPFYEAEWYRKDVKMSDRQEGLARLPSVRIEVSGLTSNLVSYSKLFMPVGADFEIQQSDKKQ